jgi:hypothetical protein
MITELYRYIGWGASDYTKVSVDLTTYPVLKETQGGYWINRAGRKNVTSINRTTCKWVSKDTCHKFAYETIETAMINFLARKHKQIRIVKSQLSQAKEERRIIRDMIEKAKVTVPNRYAV